MMRRIPNSALPHRERAKIRPLVGSNAAGRTYGPEVVVARSLIVDGQQLAGNQYAKIAELSAVVYCNRDEFASLPAPDSEVVLHAGTVDERAGTILRVERYHHPKIADLVVVLVK